MEEPKKLDSPGADELGTRIVRRVLSRYVDVVSEAPALDLLYGAKASRAAQVAELLTPILRDESQEVFVALLLDVQNNITGFVEVSRGTLTSSLVHPREFFGPALRLGAAAAIAAHNHPSGDPTPSSADRDVTRRLIKAGEIVGIPLLDHVVIGSPGRFSSLRCSMDFT